MTSLAAPPSEMSLFCRLVNLYPWIIFTSVYKTEINGLGDSLRWPRDTFYSLKLALTSPTSGGRSVGIVRWRTKAPEFVLFFNYTHLQNTVFFDTTDLPVIYRMMASETDLKVVWVCRDTEYVRLHSRSNVSEWMNEWMNECIRTRSIAAPTPPASISFQHI
jgi:hypothetical protein